MAQPRETSTREPSGIGIWPLLLVVAAVILAAAVFFMSVPIKEPVPTPDSPAAMGIDGAPAGATGPEPQPGAPEGAEVPPAVAPVEPAPADPAPAGTTN